MAPKVSAMHKAICLPLIVFSLPKKWVLCIIFKGIVGSDWMNAWLVIIWLGCLLAMLLYVGVRVFHATIVK
jgi:uncharacterized membrane protein YjjP (DUF1212 family)